MDVSGAVADGASGVKHFGGVSGSENAGSGSENGRQLRGSPSFRKQLFNLLCNLPSPAEPGNANPVVAGSGLKMRCPVESMAGSRNREQPSIGSKATINTAAHDFRWLSPLTIPNAQAFSAFARFSVWVNRTVIDLRLPDEWLLI